MKPLSEFCSINPNCPEHGNRDGKNLRVHQMYALRKPKQTRNGVLWGKKEEVCQDEEKEEHGDQWEHVVHVVIDAESKAVISLVTGKRTKENIYHVCQSWLCMTYYNFCWDHSSLRIGTMDMKYIHRSPMMTLGVTDYIWLIEDMVSYQVIKDH